MSLVVYPGETVRVWAKKVTHADTGVVTAGATVTVQVFTPSGTQEGGDLAGGAAGNGDWYADFAVPALGAVGEWVAKITAVVAGATWKGKDSFRVEPF